MASPTGTAFRAGRSLLTTGRIHTPARFTTSCLAQATATSHRPTSACLIGTRSAPTWQRTFATSAYAHSQPQTQTQTQTPAATSSASSSSNNSVAVKQDGSGKKDKDGGKDNDEEEAQRNLPLSPYGGRFGVPEQPMSTKSKALAQANTKRSPFAKAKDGVKNKVSDWTDEKKNLEKRKELLHDFQSGYFAEFSELSRTGSKLWKGTTNMIQAEKALYMPNIIGTSLKTSEPVELVDLLRGKISVVAISGTRFGEEQIETFMAPFLDKWPIPKDGNSKVQLVELNIQENPLKAGLVRMMVPFVRKSIPEPRHANYVLHYKSIGHLKDPLSMQNSYLGYVFLVDSNCKIRWGAHGKATEAELKTLLESVQRLSERGGR
ncbi:Mitochondrial ATPase complex subunit atp10 [Dissophora globulifera]|uniref:Mitochondrial ATPase complex subunit atp10 n=1 Tax=Dissophora globulifera TaxID=979702 RepID=A0A9P6RAB3_9FUNG|nr:Mitochondrial ATPase complex subunit atp10 [Dissophora globulifera]